MGYNVFQSSYYGWNKDNIPKWYDLYIIKQKARELGYNRKGNTNIEKILVNPVYAGMLHVKPYKEYPGGLFPAILEPIIDIDTWKIVQDKMKKPVKFRTVIDDQIPLRGLLKCHCGQRLVELHQGVDQADITIIINVKFQNTII